MFTGLPVLAHADAQIDAVVMDEMAKQNIIGMAVGIVRNGNIYFARGYGHADLARNIPVTTNTLFRWSSVSKTLTAAAALKLAEENPAFSLNDKVTEHVSYWPAHGNKGKIRIRHLLSNRAGIIHYKKKKHCRDNRSPDYARRKHTSTLYNAKQGVDVFRNQKLCFDPGTAYKYSTFGYSLLGSAIEGGSGIPYAAWVNDRIRIPLGMASLRQATGTRTGFDQHCQILQQLQAGNSAWKLPGGGWESDILDLARFANGLLQGSLLDHTNRLWTTVPGNPAYGYGIKYTPDKRQVWHEGKNDNSRALLYLYPGSADRLGIVLMINGVHSKPRRIAHHLANLFGRNHNVSDAPVVKQCDDACSGRFSAVWRRTNRDVLLRRGYRHENFFAEWKFLRRAGYYTDDFEPYVRKGKVYWDAVFRKGPGANAMWHNFDDEGFEKKWAEQSSQGYHLVDLETYTIDGKRRWAGLFRPGSGKYAMARNLTTAEFATLRNERAKQGFQLIDLEAYSHGGRLNWAGVWQAGDGGPVNYNLSTPDFAALRSKRIKQGYRLIDIESYDHTGERLWAGIWEKSPSAEKYSRDTAFCDLENASGDLITEGITSLHNEWREQGYELLDWERD